MLSTQFNFFSDTMTIIWTIPVTDFKDEEGREIRSPMFSPPDPLSRNSWRLEVTRLTADKDKCGVFLRKIAPSSPDRETKLTIKITVRDTNNHRIVSTRLANWILFTDPTVRIGWNELFSVKDLHPCLCADSSSPSHQDPMCCDSVAATEGDCSDPRLSSSCSYNGRSKSNHHNEHHGSQMISLKVQLMFHESCIDQRTRDRALKLMITDLSSLFMDRTFLNVNFHSVQQQHLNDPHECIRSGMSSNSLRVTKTRIQHKCDVIINLIACKMMEHESIVAEAGSGRTRSHESQTAIQVMRDRLDQLSVLESLIELCVKGFIGSRLMTPVLALKLFALSHRYRISFVTRFTEEFIIRNLSEETAIISLIHGHHHSSRTIVSACIRFLEEKYCFHNLNKITVQSLSRVPSFNLLAHLHPHLMHKVIKVMNKDKKADHGSAVIKKLKKETIV
jgi:hypothetical protein